ncbi:MAG: winged helix-turn-helix domain-containing protein [Solirubrobacterales bacterium]|jgi:DNA-binding winged helix-turn-helix (wHTH) protein/tetratricopeptide (TPR) repeat protein
MTDHRGFAFGSFVLDTESHVLWRGPEVVPLTPKAAGLLEALLEKEGDVVAKAALIGRVWPDTVVEEANLSVTISALRRVLGLREDGTDWVETVSRRGYRFRGPVKTLGATRRLALAVLPLRSLGAAEGHLGLGMADALINRLVPLPGLLVRPIGAVLRYADHGADPAAAARELGVDAVLEGTLQRDGERLRVSLRLLPTTDELPHWADRFDVPFTDLFAVEDEIAERVVRALGPRLEPGARPAGGGRRHAPRLDAYEAYLRGRLFWSRFDGEGLGKAVACFQEASELDPAYADPHAGLADAFLILALAGIASPAGLWPEARAEAEEALRLDPDLPEARIAMGFLRLFQDLDWTGARRELDRATVLSPRSISVLQWRGLFLALSGDVEAARIEMARAREADPLSLVASTVSAFVHNLAREYTVELRLARRAAELQPDRFIAHWCLGVALVHAGLFEEAVGALRRAVELAEGSAFMKPVLAWTLARAGRVAESRGVLAELEEGGSYVSPYQRATVLVALGERELALEALALGADARDPWMTLLKVDPMLDPIRDDPRFAGLEKSSKRG